MLFAIAAAVVPAGDAAAQVWPAKPVRLVVPFSPGAITDILARLVADKLGPRLGQPVVTEYKPGAGGSVGAKFVADSPPDGYTVLIASHPGFTTAPALSKDPGFDPVRDFTPVTGLVKFYMLLGVHPSVPTKNLQEFVTYAKARPGKLNYGTPGVGMPHHLAMELLMQTAGIELVHVPYKGGALATQDLIAGRVQVMFGSWGIFGQHVQSGRLKAVGASGVARMYQAPDIRTIAEQGYPSFDVWSWIGLLAPAGTPPEVVARLAQEAQLIVAMPEIKERVLKFGMESMPGTSPAAFAEQVKTDVAAWGKIIRDANIKPE
ncbi:MAG: tripartite tricarboxylate transporter substrate binding protein [Betaproteobacteria bacterium]|nr:tripartite tricarboxylate transporter substrate binding protein [Betaproteobacteria bacterium]